jgi:hypothetical protein
MSNTNSQPVPSTPPNNTNSKNNQPQSTRQESSHLRTPSFRPGYIATQSDSRRTLVPNVAKVEKTIPVQEDDEDKPEIVEPAGQKRVPAKNQGVVQKVSPVLKYVLVTFHLFCFFLLWEKGRMWTQTGR